MALKKFAIYRDPAVNQLIRVDAWAAKKILAASPATEFFSSGHRVYPRSLGGSSAFAYWPNWRGANGVTAPETLIHRLAKQVLLERLQSTSRLSFALPGRTRGDDGWSPFIDVIRAASEVRIQNAETGNVIQPDVLLRTRISPLGHWVGIEFRNTHAVDDRKKFLIRQERISALEIDLIDFVEIAVAVPEAELRVMLDEFLAATIPAKVLAIVRREDRRAHDDAHLMNALNGSRLER